MIRLVALGIALALVVAGCGGSSSSSEGGVLLEGTLTEGSGATHGARLVLRHAAGQRIEDVQICALGRCSVTDDDGQWGFYVNQASYGITGFAVTGHGIDAGFEADLTGVTSEGVFDLEHVEGGQIKIARMWLDGELHGSHSDHSHDDHFDGEHSH